MIKTIILRYKIYIEGLNYGEPDPKPFWFYVGSAEFDYSCASMDEAKKALKKRIDEHLKLLNQTIKEYHLDQLPDTTDPLGIPNNKK